MLLGEALYSDFFSACHSLGCFPNRPVSFPETNQTVGSCTIYPVLGLGGWGAVPKASGQVQTEL